MPSDTRSRPAGLTRTAQRWGRRFGTAAVLAVLLLLLGVVILWSYGGNHLARRATDLLNRHVFAEDTRLALGDVGGFPLHRIEIDGVTFSLAGPDSGYRFAQARNLRVTYDLWGILNGRYVASEVEADGLRLEFRNFGEGPIRIPRTRPGDGGDGEGKGKGKVPAFWVKKVVLHDAAVLFELPWRLFEVDSVEAELAVRADGEEIRFEVKELTGRVAGTGARLEIAGGALVMGDELAFDGIEGDWGGSPFLASGSPGDLDMDVTVRDLPLARLGRFLELGNTLDPGYIELLEGHVREDEDRVVFTWNGAASWKPYRSQAFSGRGTIAGRRLLLEDLELRTEDATFTGTTVDIPFDTPTVSVDARFTDLHTRSLRVESLEDWPGVLSGHGRVTVRDRTDPFHRVEARLVLGRGHLLEVPFVDGRVAGVIRDDTWNIDTLRVNLEQASLVGKGVMAPETIDLSFDYTGDLRPWRRFLRRDRLEGLGRLSVRLEGAKDRPVLTARGGLRRLEIAGIRAPEVELQEASGVVVGGRSLDLEFVAPRGVQIADWTFSHAEGDLMVGENVVTMNDLRIDSGDTTITVAGDLRWEPNIRIRLERADAVLGGRRFWVEEPGTLVFENEVLRAADIRVLTPRGAFTVAGSWNTGTRFVNGAVRFASVDPSVFFPPETPPPVAVGKIEGSCEVVGIYPNLNGSVDLGFREVDWKGGHLDSATVKLSVEGRAVHADRVEARVRGGSLLAFGDLVFGGPALEEVVALVGGTPPDPDSVRVDLDLHAYDARLPYWRFLLPGRKRAAGVVEGNLRVQGTAADPRMEVAGSARNLLWRLSESDSTLATFEADTLRFEGKLAGDVLTLDRLQLVQVGKASTLRGDFPLELTLHPFAWSIPERPMDLTVETGGITGLAAIPPGDRRGFGSLRSLQLTPWFKSATGNLQALVAVTGTPRHPLFHGEATVTEGRLEIRGRDELVVDAEARFRFEGDLVRVEEATGRVGVVWSDPHEVGGLVTASGTYRLGAREEETYELEVHADRAVVGEQGVYAARVSGDLTLRPERAADGKIYPYARGRVFAHRVEYAGTLEPQDIGRIEPQPILYSIQVDAPSRVLIRTEKVEAEMGGELTVHQTEDHQEIFGEMEIYQGSYQFFQKTFKVTRGTLLWQRADSRLPELDVTAETRDGCYVIRVDVTGPLEEPVLVFSARCDDQDAELTQDEIIQLLAVGSLGLSASSLGMTDTETNAAGPETSERVAVATSQLFLGPLERELARQIGFVDEVDLETGGDQGEFVPRVGVRKWVTPDLSVQYRQGLSGTYEQELGVEYRLRRALYLRGGMTNDYLRSRGSTQSYNLDLKFRLDY